MLKALTEIIQDRSKLIGKGITFIESSEKEDFLSYQELFSQSLQVLSFLQNKGLKSKDELVFQIDDNKRFVIVFWACVLGGIIPVPLSVGRNIDHRNKLVNVWGVLNNPYLIISSVNLQRLLKHIELNRNDSLYNAIITKSINDEDIYSSSECGVIHKADENDIAYIQFSSGSTGNPKGVTLTHKNLLTNIKGISEASLYTEKDSKLSWMPLTHDMGLIGFHLCPLFCGMNHILIPTNLFIRRPGLWLDKATQHKASILCSPNFGYKYLLKHYYPENEYQWNLRNVRVVYNGAEPISEEICSEFLDVLKGYGLSETAMYPVYGLAEASLAVTFSRLDEEVVSLNIDRTKTHIGDTIFIEKRSENTVSFVNVGKAIPYCSIQIRDDNCRVCGEDVIGHILIKGENVTAGYYNNSEAIKQTIIEGGWLNTGDLGFIHEGCLYVTGRYKDIIFINGQNYYPHDIERSLESIEIIELGKVVVAGNTGKETREEEIVVFILYKGKTEKFIEIQNLVKTHINQFFGFVPDYVIPVRELPKTTSGKIQRFKLIEEYTSGTFNEVIQEIKSLAGIQQSNGNYIEPVNETEQKLIEIWSNILSYNNFGVTQKFFEIGGNSLKGAQVISAIHKEFDVELDYSLLFEKQTIQEIAQAIKGHEIKQYEAITKVKEQDSYPLSSAQKRLYYLWEVDKTSIAYNIPVAFTINGQLEAKKLEEAVNQLLGRHEILRASFFMSNGEPRQLFSEKENFNLIVNPIDPQNIREELGKRVNPFDLNKPPLFRIELLNISNERNLLFLDFHHIISDGVSISLFLNELFTIYHGRKLPDIEIQYKDYTQWENNKNIESEKFKKQAEYWLLQFNEDVPVLNLPTDFSRPSLMKYHGEKLEFQIDATLTNKLRNLAKQENTSLFVLLLAAYNILLSKYTGQEDIVIGVPVAGRSHASLQPLLGMFVNNLAIRSYPEGNLTFVEFLKQIHNATSQALGNQDYPFEKLVAQIGQKRDVSRNALFDTMFMYQNMDYPDCKKDNLSVVQYFFDPGFSKYDISLEVFEQAEEIKYFIEYSTVLFRKDTITRIASHFINLLEIIVETSKAKLSDLTVINAVEYKRLVTDFSVTNYDYPKDKGIQQLIKAQALKYPEKIAVVRGDINNGTNNMTTCISQLTYKELNDKSNQLANFLRKKGVVPNIPVAIVLERTPELIIAILGILKAGGCYLPIDQDIPEERIKYILKDSQATVVISDSEWINTFTNRKSNIQFFDIANQNLYASEPITITNISSPHNLAYIIYTSGTTGNPKGVMVEHQSLVNYSTFANKTYVNGEQVSFPLYTSISFDLTITSIFTPLISGNTIVTYPDNERSLSLEDVISDNQIHVLKATPSHLKMLKENRTLKGPKYISNVKRIIVGGEALTTQLATDIYNIFNGKIEIFNEYGPTEATVGCMIYKYDKENNIRHSVPVGKPADNSQIFLLDRYLRPVPVGVAGEMYISGDCLARGYLFNPQLTERKFINNPYNSGQKMYKSGDLARMLPDGNIEFIGRVDQQVKINGYRIELEEIQQHILMCDGISETAVIVSKDGTLCAYVVLKENEEGNKEQGSIISNINHYLNIHLPHYMLPKHIIPVDFIPLTNNGKINHTLLPTPNQNIDVKEEASNDIQKVMVSVWKDVLNKSEIGITSNFFELGGDSIKAVQISSRLFDKNISVNVKDILTYQTIEQLYLHAEISDGSTHFEQGIMEGEIELNPIQKWFFEHNFENPHFYNQSVLLKCKRSINKEILKESFKILIEHHDGLRMNYNPEKHVMYYNNDYLDREYIVKEYTIESQVTSYSSRTQVKSINSKGQLSKDNIQDICQEIRSSFNIENTLLIQLAIIKEGNTNLLFITAHHLIIDGVSWRILMEDFYSIYTSLEKGKEIKLPKKTASLMDWNKKLLEFSNSEELKNQLKYWKHEVYNQNILTPDSCLPSFRVEDIQKTSFQLTEDETQFLLTDANKPYNTNIEILLVTALIKTLKEWENFDDVIIDMENHGRHFGDVDVSRTIGWFTSMFPVKFNCSNNSLGEQIKLVKEKIRNVPDSGSGYGVLKNFNNSLKGNSQLLEVRFNYLGQFGNELDNDLFEYKNVEIGSEIDVKNHFTTGIEINAMLINNKLLIETNSIEEFDNSIIELYQNNINCIIAYLKDEEDIHFTPSDFDAVELDEEDLKVLFG